MDERSLRRELAAIEQKLSELSECEQRSLEKLFEQQDSSDDGASPLAAPRHRRGSFAALPGAISSASFRPGELREAAESLEIQTELQRQHYEQALLSSNLQIVDGRPCGCLCFRVV